RPGADRHLHGPFGELPGGGVHLRQPSGDAPPHGSGHRRAAPVVHPRRLAEVTVLARLDGGREGVRQLRFREPVEALVPVPDEGADAAAVVVEMHLAVGDDVQPGELLVLDARRGGVPPGVPVLLELPPFQDVGAREVVAGVPPRLGVRADHRRREERRDDLPGHGHVLSDGARPTGCDVGSRARSAGGYVCGHSDARTDLAAATRDVLAFPADPWWEGRVSVVDVSTSLRPWMTAVGEISRAVNAGEPLEVLLTLIAERVCALIGFDHCAVMLADDDQAHLHAVGWSGLSDAYVALVRDGAALPALLAGPLRTARSGLAGVVVAYSMSARAFSDLEIELIELLADQAALALETSGLRADQQSVIRELSLANVELRTGRAALERAEQQHRDLMAMVLADVGLDRIVGGLAQALDASVTVEDADG